MSVSAIFGTRLVVPPPSYAATKAAAVVSSPPARLAVGGGSCGLVIECSSRPQKKATAHHRKTRPRKNTPSDIRHGPAVYAPLPPLPPEWTLLSATEAEVPVPAPEPALISE